MPEGLLKKDIGEVAFGNTTRGFHGRAWCWGKRVHVGIPKHVRYGVPRKSGGFRGYLPIDLYSWEEHLVEIVAHELRHIWQYKKGRLPRETKSIRYYNMGTKADLGEVDASLYAKRKVREYRRDSSFKVAK